MLWCTDDLFFHSLSIIAEPLHHDFLLIVYRSDLSLLHTWHWLFHCGPEGIHCLIMYKSLSQVETRSLVARNIEQRAVMVRYNPEIGGSEPPDKGEVSRRRLAQSTLSGSQSVGCMFCLSEQTLITIYWTFVSLQRTTNSLLEFTQRLIPCRYPHRATGQLHGATIHTDQTTNKHSCHMLAPHCALCALT